MAKRLRQNEDEPEKVKYFIKRSSGAFFIEVPANWKVTFGYVNPNTRDVGMRGMSAHCVRVWEGEKLRAVFSDCIELRDVSIPYAVKVERETGSATWEKDSIGNFEGTEKRQIESFVEIDEADVDF